MVLRIATVLVVGPARDQNKGNTMRKFAAAIALSASLAGVFAGLAVTSAEAGGRANVVVTDGGRASGRA